MMTTILFACQYDMGYSTALKAPPFMNYLLALALAAFRFNTFLPSPGALRGAGRECALGRASG